MRALYILRLLACALACSLLGGCQSQDAAFHGTDLTGANFGQNFQLKDPDGKGRSLADFRGKVVTVFFGYTHCPDVCPTNLSAMAQAMAKLGKDGDKLQVLFITVDPQRDTPALLKEYVPAFHPSFLGLWGDDAATQKVTADFKVFYQKQPGSTPDTYLVDHSSGTYVFDPQGRLRLLIKHGEKIDNIVDDIKLLLNGR